MSKTKLIWTDNPNPADRTYMSIATIEGSDDPLFVVRPFLNESGDIMNFGLEGYPQTYWTVGMAKWDAERLHKSAPATFDFENDDAPDHMSYTLPKPTEAEMARVRCAKAASDRGEESHKAVSRMERENNAVRNLIAGFAYGILHAVVAGVDIPREVEQWSEQQLKGETRNSFEIFNSIVNDESLKRLCAEDLSDAISRNRKNYPVMFTQPNDNDCGTPKGADLLRGILALEVQPDGYSYASFGKNTRVELLNIYNAVAGLTSEELESGLIQQLVNEYHTRLQVDLS